MIDIKQYIKVMKRLYLLIIPLLIQSCSTMYIPASRSIPLLEKQGEFQMETGVSTNSVYANVSAAMTNDIAVSINGNLSCRNFTDYYDVFTRKDAKGPTGFLAPDLRGMFAHRYGEISAGKINILPKLPMTLEIFSGAGMGRATDVFAERVSNFKTDYYSFFGQGNFGMKWQKVETGASVRFAYSMFNYTYNHYGTNREDDFFQTIFSTVSFEPMGVVRVGKKNLKAVFRIGFNFMLPINLNKETARYYRGFTDYGNLDYTVFHFSAGLSYRIGGNKNMK